MRILHVLEAIEGGTARHLIDVVSSVDAEHHVAVPDRRVGARTFPGVHAALAANAVVHRVDMRRSATSPRNLNAVRTVRSLVRSVRPDLLHGHSSVGGAVARLALGGGATAVPVVWTPNGVAPSRGALLIERALAHRTSLAIAVSDSEASVLLARRLARRDRLAVVPNGISRSLPAAPFDVRAKLGLAPHATIALCIARLVPQKDPATFAAAIAALGADVEGVLVGDGPLDIAAHPRLHQLSVEAGAAGLIGQADVVVLTSRFEGGPYVPIEAFRAGVPIVATDCVGTRDAVIDGVTGLLAPIGSVSAVASAVRRVLADAALRDRLVHGGRQAFDDRYSIDAMAAGLSGAYHRALAGG